MAFQESSLGNGTGKSNPVTFVVNTSPPTVLLNQPETPSNHTRPSFTGYGSDTTQVTIEIYAGGHVSGSPVSSATAEGNGGDWTSGSASAELSSGTYTAVATQPSSLGNSPGTSTPVTFVVETGPPHVTLNQPKTPSNNTTPSFSGEASDKTTVTVDIYAGAAAEGPVVSIATANGNGGDWSSGKASNTLSTGEYTAVAVQESSLLGNPNGVSSAVHFTVDTRSPTVTLVGPSLLSNHTKPSFSGEASDHTEVVVHILHEGSEVAHATAPTGGSWSTSNESSLGSGTYTAYATQESSLGNPPGTSNQVSFTVDTASPVVSLVPPAVRSNNTTPSFTGTATDSTPVTLHLYKGSRAEGTAVATLTAEVTAGTWTTAAVPALANGQYTAIATEPSSLENPEGRSLPATFEVNNKSPDVVLNQPKSPWHETSPIFTGTGTETTTVKIKVYKGAKAEGTEVSSATAPGTGGEWTAGPDTSALVSGTYTATATQESLFGNGPGVSAPVTFIVETASPKVTLTAFAKPLSNDTMPTFTGTASDIEPVTVHIYKGTKVEVGALVSNAVAPGTRAGWTSAAATPALVSGQYTAVAEQPSSAGNAAGTSVPIQFTVNTAPPTVVLNQPISPSKVTTPVFTGEASDTTKVTVHIYNSLKAEVTSASGTPSGKTFSATGETILPDGTYTASASEESSLGNPAGVSNTVTFTVDTLPPAVTLTAPPSPSNDRTPVFSGTATDTTPVTVKIYRGVKVSGSPLATASAPSTGAAWTSAAATPALLNEKETYTAVATEESSIGNGPGTSAPPVHFTVDPKAPTVTLNRPPAWTNNTTPSFSGTAEDITPVKVEIYAGANVEEGKPKAVAIAEATGTGGGWGPVAIAPALPDGPYTAVAIQHNKVAPAEEGSSQRFTFTVDTVPPDVTLSGTAVNGGAVTANGGAGSEPGDLPSVTVQVFSGSSIAGGQSPVQSVIVGAAGKTWSATLGGLGPGTYTLRAQQSDQAGNVGTSSTSTFSIAGPPPPSSPPGLPAAPAASFAWFPAAPHVGERVSLASSATDSSSPITAFAWDLKGNGALVPGSQLLTTSFSTTGKHVVRLRVTAANGLASVATETIPVSPARLFLMQPFPSVRIVTSHASGGVKLKLLIIQAPIGARIAVKCNGKGCPAKSQTQVAKASKVRAVWVAFRKFERLLPTGVTLEIRVFKAGEIGKYTRFVVRRRGAPERYDTCLGPAGVKPVGCPAR